MQYRGFTLLELLITITIAGVILSTGLYSFFSLQKSMHIIDNQKDILVESNHIVSTLRDTIRYSDDLESDMESYTIADNKLYYNGISLLSDAFIVNDTAFIEVIKSDTDALQPRVKVYIPLTHKALDAVKTTIDTSISSRYYTLKYQ